ncbi:type I secretion system permease/ATPase [Photobacterium sanctipauli]|uniref:Type I secretion system permease/ATPase n=2 Tax=Photobacterium sanctipauli TaxID=1342794 RepID=A0A2T3NX26_9GAMM|nr:type I secretion system permease/ATPase [Photobacterium sanctipauli]PSW20759.1 type I secretion system permease/ATPase [Photobacterium sanctipauli]
MNDPLLAALTLVCRHYGQHCSAKSLTAGLPLPDGILTPHLFPRAASNAGLSAIQENIPLSQLSPLLLPAVVLMENRQACVVLDINPQSQQAHVALNVSGESRHENHYENKHENNHKFIKQWLPINELEKQFLNTLFLLKKPYQFDERSPISSESADKAGSHWFWDTIWQSKAIYRDVFIASILLNLFAVALPLFTRLVYDKIVPNQAFDSLWVLVSGMAVILCFDLLLKVLRNYFIDIAGKKSDILMSSAIYSKAISLKSAARPPSVGAFARHLQEFEAIRELFTSSTIAAAIDLPFALFFILVIWLIAGPLVIIPIAAVLILIVYSLIVQKPLQTSIEEGSKLASQKQANLVESLFGFETVKLFNASSQFQYKWEQAVAHMANWGIKSRRLTDSVGSVASTTQQGVSIAVIVFGVYLIAAGELSVGGLIATSMLTSRAIAPMVQLSQLSTRYQQAKSAMGIINQLMASPSELNPQQGYLSSVSLSGAICCDHLSFSYPSSSAPLQGAKDTSSSTKALDGISLTIQPGEKVAIIGKIGSGKSTLLRLIMGLYPPTDGAIRLNNTDIHQFNPVDIRHQIGCVPQDIVLFFGSIRDNIILGQPQASEQAIQRACEQSGVSHFIQHEPSGLNRQIGENGNQLSGGQKQAIAIARALVSQPNILLLDEPTSSMDNRAEQHFKRYLTSLDKHHTLLLFSHKSSMLEVVDRIIVLDRGKVVADGDREHVLNQLKR